MPADHDFTPRERAAKAIQANPQWPYRAIAREAAVSITTMRNVRGRLQPKLKPRERAAEALAAYPGLSLSAIAKKTHASPATMRSVMRRELPNQCAKAIGAKKKQPPRARKKLVPSPLRFDLNALPGTGFLTERETAAALRRSPMVLTRWRKEPNHPLRLRMIGDRLMYEARSVREFLRFVAARTREVAVAPRPMTRRIASERRGP